jgi:hypothetical protein
VLPNTDLVLLPPVPSRPINLHVLIIYRQKYRSLFQTRMAWLGVEHRMAQDLWPVGVMLCVCVLLVALVYAHLAIRLLR